MATRRNGTSSVAIGKAVFTSYGPSFDGVVAAQDGRHVSIYQRLGTKALLLRDGKLAYELDRSYYNAQVFEYPIGFVPLPGGRTGFTVRKITGGSRSMMSSRGNG